jgi:hypothetical protein
VLAYVCESSCVWAAAAGVGVGVGGHLNGLRSSDETQVCNVSSVAQTAEVRLEQDGCLDLALVLAVAQPTTVPADAREGLVVLRIMLHIVKACLA